MIDSQDIFTVCLPDEEETALFGNSFGTYFLYPLVHAPNENVRPSLVVGVFGDYGSGKSTLLSSISRATIAAKKEVFNYWSCAPQRIPYENAVFRRADLRGITLISETLDDHLQVRLTSLTNSALHQHYAYILLRTKEDGPGIDFIEHPTIAHLQPEGVTIFCSRVQINDLAYFNHMKKIIKSQTDSAISFANAASLLRNAEQVNQGIDHVQGIIRDHSRQKPSKKRQSDTTMLATVLLMKEGEPVRTAFDKFRAYAADYLELVS